MVNLKKKESAHLTAQTVVRTIVVFFKLIDWFTRILQSNGFISMRARHEFLEIPSYTLLEIAEPRKKDNMKTKVLITIKLCTGIQAFEIYVFDCFDWKCPIQKHTDILYQCEFEDKNDSMSKGQNDIEHV